MRDARKKLKTDARTAPVVVEIVKRRRGRPPKHGVALNKKVQKRKERALAKGLPFNFEDHRKDND
jgi:U3 small nucleolar RNA-associated protein 14